MDKVDKKQIENKNSTNPFKSKPKLDNLDSSHSNSTNPISPTITKIPTKSQYSKMKNQSNVSSGEENKITDPKRHIIEEENESGVIENENMLEKMYEESQANLETYLLNRLTTNSTDNFGNYLTSSPYGNEKKKISYKNKSPGNTPKKLSYSQQLSPLGIGKEAKIRESLLSHGSLNNSQLVSLNLSIHKSKTSNKDANKMFFEECQDNVSDLNNRWDQTQKIAKSERAKVKYNKINFNREDKIFPITSKNFTGISPIVRLKTNPIITFQKLSDSDVDTSKYQSSIRRSHSLRTNQENRKSEKDKGSVSIQSSLNIGLAKKSSFVTDPSNRSTIFNSLGANGKLKLD